MEPLALDHQATHEAQAAFITELATRLHVYGTSAQRLEGAVAAVAHRLGLDCQVVSNPTGLILSFANPARVLWEAFDGSWRFYVWMTFLTAVFLVGANAWAVQVRDGMGVTALNDHVSWGLYIANFTFLVGLAAGGVMMVIPAYLYHDEEMHDIVIIGELLAIAALFMALFFVVVDLGRPDRFWHLLPGPGRFNFPLSSKARS